MMKTLEIGKYYKCNKVGHEYPTGKIFLVLGRFHCPLQGDHLLRDGSCCPGRFSIEVIGEEKGIRDGFSFCFCTWFDPDFVNSKVFLNVEECEKPNVEECEKPNVKCKRMFRLE